MGIYNEKLKLSTQKYIKNNYDVITAYAQKGNREIYKEYAQSVGHSLNSLIITLLDKELYEQSLKEK